MTTSADEPELPLTRRALPYLAGFALCVLAAFAFQTVVTRDDAVERLIVEELNDRLDERVRSFEQSLLVIIEAMIDDSGNLTASHHDLQRRWRRQFPWFDSLYVWKQPDPALVPREVQPAFVYPDAGKIERGGQRTKPCIEAARVASAEAFDGPVDAIVLASAYMLACRGQGLAAEAFASTQAAQVLFDDGDPHAALRAFNQPGLTDGAPLNAYPDIPVAQRVSRRLQRADLLEAVGRRAEADRIRFSTIAESASLDGPTLDETLFLVTGVLDDLRERGLDLGLLSAQIGIAEQRLAAYREIRQRAARPVSPRTAGGGRFTWDQYSTTPFLLYSQPLADGTGGIALQLRQDVLLRQFLRSESAFVGELVVSDNAGRPVAGAVDERPSDISARFSETLSHLEAHLTQAGLARRVAPTSAISFWIGLVFVVCVGIGMYALLAQSKAAARHRLLLRRQRDFTARVTHELKTPLAGIRVMAENIALGAVRDDAQREMMANRIVDEADRLTMRVDEILSASRSREIPEPVPFDLEEILFELIDEWGPRYEQSEVEFAAEFDPVDAVQGDPRAMRDALACLLDNALKYRDPNRKARVEIALRGTERHAIVEVTDNGIGVPEGQRDAIFEKFVRVEGPNRGKSGGHGLGARPSEGHRRSTPRRCTLRSRDRRRLEVRGARAPLDRGERDERTLG